MPALIDLVGHRYGKLTVSRMHHERCSSGKTQWVCVCDCGSEKVVRGNDLRTGKISSCECNRTKHGHTKGPKGTKRYTPEYRAWSAMKQRCCDPNNDSFVNYGGRGISICDEWINDFSRFFNDMGSKPSRLHSLERKDVNGNYEPNNCTWALPVDQSRNQRVTSRSKTGVRGVYVNRGKYAAHIYVNSKRMVLGSFLTKKDATEARKEAENKYW